MGGHAVEAALGGLPQILWAGLCLTMPLTAVSGSFGVAIAIAVALIRTRPQVSYGFRGFLLCAAKGMARAYAWVFRGTPLMVQLFIAFYGLPHVGIRWSAMACAVIVLSLNVGAYASETVRGAIDALPKGQYEAALSLGMGHWQAMAYVILPQALRDCVPALFNTLISLVKDTSLTASITVAEMLMTTQRVVAVTYEPLALYAEVALVYLAICSILSVCQQRLQQS